MSTLGAEALVILALDGTAEAVPFPNLNLISMGTAAEIPNPSKIAKGGATSIGMAIDKFKAKTGQLAIGTLCILTT